MSVRSIVGTLSCLAAVAVAVLCAPSCGPSALSKAYGAYIAKIERPLLDRDASLWKKVSELHNEQRDPNTANPQKYEECLLKEAIPFYDEFATKVHEIAPGDPGLAQAHDALIKYAEARASFVHYLADNRDVVNRGAGGEALDRRSDAAEGAVQEYERLTQGPGAAQDPRFIELRAVKDDFVRSMGQFGEGKTTQQDLSDYIRKSILPRIEKLRTGKFADDEAGRTLHEAIGSWQDLFTAVAEHLPFIDREARFGEEVKRRIAETDDLLRKFQDAMASVRRRK